MVEWVVDLVPVTVTHLIQTNQHLVTHLRTSTHPHLMMVLVYHLATKVHYLLVVVRCLHLVQILVARSLVARPTTAVSSSTQTRHTRTPGGTWTRCRSSRTAGWSRT